jgi:hypothetical protein
MDEASATRASSESWAPRAESQARFYKVPYYTLKYFSPVGGNVAAKFGLDPKTYLELNCLETLGVLG